MNGIKEGNKPSLVLKEKGKPFDFSGILTPLKQTGGIIFPFTPTIQFSHQTSYGTYDVHILITPILLIRTHKWINLLLQETFLYRTE